MSTAFSQDRFDFTKRAHLAARRQFYARMYPHGVAFVDTTQTAHDLDYAIDCELSLTLPGSSWHGPTRMSVQERFRKPQEMHWGDVTITEWNLATNEPSELHKLAAQMFVYGFYDDERDHIDLAVAFDVALMQYALSRSDLGFHRRRRGDQSFVAVPYAELYRIGAVMYKHYPAEQETAA